MTYNFLKISRRLSLNTSHSTQNFLSFYSTLNPDNNNNSYIIDLLLYLQGESNSGTGKVLKLSISLVTSAVLAMMLLN